MPGTGGAIVWGDPVGIAAQPAVAAVAVTVAVRRLLHGDAADYRDLRLDGLRRHPEAFGASWDDEAGQPLDWFAARLLGNCVFGAWLPGGVLAGVAGLSVPAAAKLRHKGALWGMYVVPEARGTGMAAALLRHVIGQAGGMVEEVLLTCTASNVAAENLYGRFGFERYGGEPRAVKVGDCYHDVVLMRLRL